MRSTRRFLAVALAVGAVVALVVVVRGGGDPAASLRRSRATDTTASQDAPSWLFVIDAGQGSVQRRDDGWVLTLRNVDDRVVAFTDRPARDARSMGVDEWLAGVDLHVTKPNAALEIDEASAHRDVFTLELTEGAFDRATSTLSFHARPIGNADGRRLGTRVTRADRVGELQFGAASLFVDNIWSNTCNATVSSTVDLDQVGPSVDKYSHDTWVDVPPTQIAANKPITIQTDSGWARGCWWDASYQWNEGGIEYRAALHASAPVSADNVASCTVTAQPSTASGYPHLKCNVSFSQSGGALGARFTIGPALSCVATVSAFAAAPLTADDPTSSGITWYGYFHPGSAPSTMPNANGEMQLMGPTTVVIDADPSANVCDSAWGYDYEYTDDMTGATVDCSFGAYWWTAQGSPVLVAGHGAGSDSQCALGGLARVTTGADPWVVQSEIDFTGAMT